MHNDALNKLFIITLSFELVFVLARFKPKEISKSMHLLMRKI